ncbi:MAG: DUF1840 domain-containing protein [Rhodocyclaceae bacterium]|nr:DUF1840 domain-containing protein [Rhodocyclaceae bacterium]MBX3669507.1 DUF1840 domain-containing protein [Rhodocyclaceae bacterium]
MLITFTSDADADVIMFGEVALRLLELAGKPDPERSGIFTVEQLADAHARLSRIADDDRARTRAARDAAERDPKQDEAADKNAVALYQRAVPLINMLAHSMREKVPVTWQSMG